MVLIATVSSSGKRGRCDARCYNGKATTKCRCICGGRNHAQGLERALASVRSALSLELLPPDRQYTLGRTEAVGTETLMG
jgi:hypothetical protein